MPWHACALAVFFEYGTNSLAEIPEKLSFRQGLYGLMPFQAFTVAPLNSLLQVHLTF